LLLDLFFTVVELRRDVFVHGLAVLIVIETLECDRRFRVILLAPKLVAVLALVRAGVAWHTAGAVS
jgi:hypothetical protein